MCECIYRTESTYMYVSICLCSSVLGVAFCEKKVCACDTYTFMHYLFSVSAAFHSSPTEILIQCQECTLHPVLYKEDEGMKVLQASVKPYFSFIIFILERSYCSSKLTFDFCLHTSY